MVPNAAESTAVAGATSIWTTPDVLRNFFAKHLLKQLLYLSVNELGSFAVPALFCAFRHTHFKTLSCILVYDRMQLCRFIAWNLAVAVGCRYWAIGRTQRDDLGHGFAGFYGFYSHLYCHRVWHRL